MDEQMLEQIQQMITTATETLRREIVGSLDQKVDGLSTSLRAEMTGMRGELRQDMAGMETRLGERIDGLELAQLGTESRVSERIDETKRHSGVLVEGLRHELQLLAEGLQMHIEERHQEERNYTDRQFQETRGLIQISYRQVNDRMEGLEQRVRSLEQQ